MLEMHTVEATNYTFSSNLKVKKLHPDAVIPFYATDGSAGADLYTIEELTLAPGEKRVIPTGLAFEMSKSLFIAIVPRSGISLKTDLRIVNSPGIIDSDYTLEVGVLAQNIGDEPLFLEKGSRVAQMVVMPYIRANFEEVDEITSSETRQGGWGSTGEK